MKTLLLIAGVVCLGFGLLFAGQGTGYIPWPRTSFMIGDTHWVAYGLGMAVVGIALIAVSARRRSGG